MVTTATTRATGAALVQRQGDILASIRSASRARRLVEDETVKRLQDIEEAYRQRAANINIRLSAVQAPYDQARTALQAVNEMYLLPPAGATQGFMVPASDQEVDRKAVEAQQTRSDIEVLASQLRIVRENKAMAIPAGMVVLGVLDFIVAGLIALIGFGNAGNSNGAGGLFFALLVAAFYGLCGYGLFAKREWARWLAVLQMLLIGYFIIPLFFIPYFFSDPVKRVYKADKDDHSVLDRLRRHTATLSVIQAGVKAWGQRALAEAGTQREQRLQETRARNATDLAAAHQTYLATRDSLRTQVRELVRDAGLLAAPWSAPDWPGWKPQEHDVLMGAVRAGTIARIDGMSSEGHEPLIAPGERDVVFPLLVPSIPGEKQLLIQASGADRDQAVKCIESMLFRLLATIPAGKLQFTFLDPVGLGQSVAPFMHLGDHDEKLISIKAWTEAQHIERRLVDLTEHMENVIQKYLRNQFASIEDYNADVGETAEAYRVLVVYDFPNNFNDAAVRRLVSIAANGPRCGVYTIVLYDPAQPQPYNFHIDELARHAQVIEWRNGRFVWTNSPAEHCDVGADLPPQAEVADRILTLVGEEAVAASRVEVPFKRVAPPPEKWWDGNTAEGIKVDIGPTGTKMQALDLGKGTAQHVLVAGKTGSGKSQLLHTLITNLALTYSPDEISFYLVDFKKGVEFKPYATHQLPHARVIAIESEREFGLSTLRGLDDELKRRGDLFRAANVENLAAYRDETRQTLPRILLLVDEFQEFFTEDDQVASHANQILDRLVRQGRAFGMHVLLGSQTLAGAYSLARSTIDQMAVRIALQCSEADSRLILAEDNPGARLLSRPGEAIYNASNGMEGGNNLFQVAFLPDGKPDTYLDQVSVLAAQRRLPPPDQIVFEGNELADIVKNQLLAQVVSVPEPPTVQRIMPAWLGEPIAIAEPTAAHFRRQSGCNLLIVGQDDEAALGMMTSAWLSLAAQLPPSAPHDSAQATFYVLDFTAVDGTYSEYFPQLAAQLPQTAAVVRRPQLPMVVDLLAQTVKQRLDAESGAQAGDEGAARPPIFLLVYGLQRARDLRQEEGLGMGFSSFEAPEAAKPDPAQQFSTIVRDGPDVGVHTLVWCDTVTNLNRSLDRRTLREFTMRVALQMSAEDSTTLMDGPMASKLGLHRAYFVSEDEGRQEKFQPYRVPESGWLDLVCRHLRQRAGQH